MEPAAFTITAVVSIMYLKSFTIPLHFMLNFYINNRINTAALFSRPVSDSERVQVACRHRLVTFLIIFIINQFAVCMKPMHVVEFIHYKNFIIYFNKSTLYYFCYCHHLFPSKNYI